MTGDREILDVVRIPIRTPMSAGAWHDDEGRLFTRGMDGRAGGPVDRRHDRDHRGTWGTFRETVAMAKAYTEARAQHGESELLDEIVAAKPKTDRTRYHSPEELKDHGLAHIREAVALLESKATTEERDDYRQFVLNLANKVAAAHREGGQSVSPAEVAAIQEITTALGTPGS